MNNSWVTLKFHLVQVELRREGTKRSVYNIQNKYINKEYLSKGIIKFQVLTKSGKCSFVSSGFPPLWSAEHLVYACATYLTLHPSGSTLLCRNIFTISPLKSFRQTETFYPHTPTRFILFSSSQAKGIGFVWNTNKYFLTRQDWKFPFCCSRCSPCIHQAI